MNLINQFLIWGNVIADTGKDDGGGTTKPTGVGSKVNQIDLGFKNLSDVFGFAVNVVLGVGIAITIIFLIVGGIQYITARGDQKAAGAARQALTNAVIGFIVVIGAFTIRTILLNVVGGVSPENLEVNGVVNF